jgi:hypothetical protein
MVEEHDGDASSRWEHTHSTRSELLLFCMTDMGDQRKRRPMRATRSRRKTRAGRLRLYESGTLSILIPKGIQKRIWVKDSGRGSCWLASFLFFFFFFSFVALYGVHGVRRRHSNGIAGDDGRWLLVGFARRDIFLEARSCAQKVACMCSKMGGMSL